LPKKALRLACIALCLPGQVERHSGMVKHFPFTICATGPSVPPCRKPSRYPCW
jgi:hypothetical protein